MADDKPATVTVKAIQEHTCLGEAYHVGDTYEVDEQLADSVVAQGKAVRVTVAEAAPAPPSETV